MGHRGEDRTVQLDFPGCFLFSVADVGPLLRVEKPDHGASCARVAFVALLPDPCPSSCHHFGHQSRPLRQSFPCDQPLCDQLHWVCKALRRWPCPGGLASFFVVVALLLPPPRLRIEEMGNLEIGIAAVRLSHSHKGVEEGATKVLLVSIADLRSQRGRYHCSCSCFPLHAFPAIVPRVPPCDSGLVPSAPEVLFRYRPFGLAPAENRYCPCS
mmetsp:Transcript_11346/g.28680  ORF Transcript_11346/g.28680 Transcript_11346/m.28680 type:complete len:213 (-) Transcript_11346:1913-2551(-)